MLTCKEVTILLSESLERNLTLKEKIQLHIHFLMCRFCKRYFKNVQLVNSLYKHYIIKKKEEIQLSDEKKKMLKEFIEKELKKD